MNNDELLITGNESPELYNPHEQVLIAFYKAFNTHDLQAMTNNWLQSDAVSMSNPLGGIKRGWHEISNVYNRIFNGKASVYVEFYGYTIHSTSDMFVAVGRERGVLTLDQADLELEIRTSRIYQRHDGTWKQVHHHGSFDDPAQLDTYQDIIMQRNGD